MAKEARRRERLAHAFGAACGVGLEWLDRLERLFVGFFCFFFLLLDSFVFLKRLNELKTRKLRKWPPSSRLRPTPTAPPRQLLWASGSSTVRRFRNNFSIYLFLFLLNPKISFLSFLAKKNSADLPRGPLQGPPIRTCLMLRFNLWFFFEFFSFFKAFSLPKLLHEDGECLGFIKSPFVASLALKSWSSCFGFLCFFLQVLHNDLHCCLCAALQCLSELNLGFSWKVWS